MRLAGTYHPIPYLLERLPDFLPGCSETAALWMEYDKEIHYNLINENGPYTIDKVTAQRIRSTHKITEWANDFDLITNVNNAAAQLSFTDENNLRVLRLCFPSPVDELKDFILIKFPLNIYIKNIDTHFNGISSNEKQLLSQFLFSVLIAEHKRVCNEREFLQNISQFNQKKDHKIATLKNALQTTETLYTTSLRTIIDEFKLDWEKNLQCKFVIDEQVISKLAKEQLNITAIKTNLKEALLMAYNLNFSSQEIKITADYFSLNKQVKTPSRKTIVQEKTLSLLDTYETAANKAIVANKTVNGKNVAAFLSPPVTPPAITDAVKKNSSKIKFILLQYPSRWPLIRQAIRPIRLLDTTSFSSSHIA